jgi:hypothetical protein
MTLKTVWLTAGFSTMANNFSVSIAFCARCGEASANYIAAVSA